MWHKKAILVSVPYPFVWSQATLIPLTVLSLKKIYFFPLNRFSFSRGMAVKSVRATIWSSVNALLLV